MSNIISINQEDITLVIKPDGKVHAVVPPKYINMPMKDFPKYVMKAAVLHLMGNNWEEFGKQICNGALGKVTPPPKDGWYCVDLDLFFEGTEEEVLKLLNEGPFRTALEEGREWRLVKSNG